MSRVLLGAAVVAVIAVASVAVFGGFTDKLTREKGEKYRAVFTDTAMLDNASPVRVKGVEQGRVSKISLRSDGRTTLVEFELFKDSVPLYEDATATMQFRNVLGGNNALNITRGTPSAGELESREIPESQTAGQVEADNVLRDLREPERAGIQTMLRETPQALADPAAPAAALDSVTAAAPGLAAGIDAARGTREGDLRRLITKVNTTVDALDDSPEQLIDVVEGGAVTVETTSARADDIRATISGADTVLPRVRATLSELDVTLDKADPLLSELQASASDVAPTVRKLRPAVADTGSLLRDARPLLSELRPAAGALALAARDGLPLVDELAPSLDRLATTILPDLNKVDQTSRRSTSTMVGATISGLAGAASNIDRVAYMVGLGGASTERGFSTAPCQTYFTDPNADEVIQCQDLAGALAQFLNYNPLDTDG